MFFRLAFMLSFVLFTSASSVSWEELKCRLCGTVIHAEERYYQVKGGKDVYCERCYTEAPRCSLCKLPTAPADLDPETGACPRCLAKLPRCKACGRAITGTAYTIAFVEGMFCAECKANRPACYVCGAPVGSGYWKYPDGRVICSECGERAVIDVDQIREIMLDAQETVERRLGLKVKTPYILRVEKLSGLPSSGPPPRGEVRSSQSPLYGKELGLYRRSGTKSEIFLLFGLTPELMYEAAAHEYAHAWEVEACPPDISPEMREGFAQWVAADVLRAKGYRRAVEKLEARTDYPYGTGYRGLKRLQPRTVLSLVMSGR